MIKHTVVLLVLLGVASPPRARAQEERVRPPGALLQRMAADLGDDDELARGGTDSLAARITVSRRDFNGDGVREWVVTGGRCDMSNCTSWIYRRLPGGRFVQVHASRGFGIRMLAARSHGWHHLGEYWYMPCCASQTSTFVFDGERYQWRETRYQVLNDTGEIRAAYRISVTAADGSGPRRLVLDPFHAAGGLRISAAYDICRAGKERADVCGAPRLVLSSARLPAGRVCVRMRATQRAPHREFRSDPGGGWCGVTVPDPNVRGRRRLVLRPRREEWAWLSHYLDVELTGPGLPGLPGRLRTEDADALASFAGQLEEHYRLPCVEGLACADSSR
jgi:hypothetical protein